MLDGKMGKFGLKRSPLVRGLPMDMANFNHYLGTNVPKNMPREKWLEHHSRHDKK